MWYSVVKCGLVWSSVVWCGMVGFGGGLVWFSGVLWVYTGCILGVYWVLVGYQWGSVYGSVGVLVGV